MTVLIDDFFAAGWRQAIHTCAACEWSGPLEALELEPHREQSEYSCPHCECLVADGPQSWILRQVANGVAVRMAALETLLG